MTKVKIDHSRLKDAFLNKIPLSELNAHEKLAYELYIWGIQDGREIALLEAVSKIDPEYADGLVAKFVGDTVESEIKE
jgi:hypothetical protein